MADTGTIKLFKPPLTRQQKARQDILEAAGKQQKKRTIKAEKQAEDSAINFVRWLLRSQIKPTKYMSFAEETRRNLWEQFQAGRKTPEVVNREFLPTLAGRVNAELRAVENKFSQVARRPEPTVKARVATPAAPPVTPTPPADIDRFIAAIRKKESGGNYKATGQPTKYGTATGAYQFLDSTWGNYKGYKRAKDAPPEIQDERARQLMTAYYNQFKDWGAVAVAWYAGPGAANRWLKAENDPRFLKSQTAGGKAFPSIQAYADAVLTLMNPQQTIPTAGVTTVTTPAIPSAPVDTSAATAYGVSVGGQKFKSQAAFDQWVKQQAKSLFPALASAIDQGITVRQYASPYIEIAAQALEKPVDAINLMDPKFRRAIDNVTPDGKRTAMSLADWETQLRLDKTGEYGYHFTRQAGNEARELVTSLRRFFGR